MRAENTEPCPHSWRCAVPRAECAQKAAGERGRHPYMAGSCRRLPPRPDPEVWDGIAAVRLEGDLDAFQAAAALQAIRDAAHREASGLVLIVNTHGGAGWVGDRLARALGAFARGGASHRAVAVGIGDFCCSAGLTVVSAADVVLARPGSLLGGVGVGGCVCLDGRPTGLGSCPAKAQFAEECGPIFARLSPGEAVREEAKLREEAVDFARELETARRLPTGALSPWLDGRVVDGEEARVAGFVDYCVPWTRDSLLSYCKTAGAAPPKRSKPRIASEGVAEA
jgi:membrane-bound ClpP family serine protease